MDRREFIRKTSLASGMLLVPSFLKAFERNLLSLETGYRNLIVIQLSGGNDSLNTIVPYTNDIYYKLRSGIAIKKEEVIKLNDLQGLHPSMTAMQKLYDQGYLTIINGVGYPNPDRSHFRSMDIWQTASDHNEYLNTGWLGRYLDATCSGKCDSHTAIEVDDTLSLALKGKNIKGLAVKDFERLYKTTKEPFFKKVINTADKKMLDEDNLGYLYKTLIEIDSSVQYIYDTGKTYTNAVEYPQNNFGKQLKNISTFINSGMQTKVYYVSHGSFDTHVNQPGNHNRLLQTFSDGVYTLVNDLKKNNKLDDTLIMVFSEFGRRVEQNAGNGTDHGTAGNMFLIGGKLKQKGIINTEPDLSNLEDGDLKHTVDFRNVYSTILSNWLNVDASKILNGNFPNMNFI
jgi:uncharacterized protein (DUF1501 family)